MAGPGPAGGIGSSARGEHEPADLPDGTLAPAEEYAGAFVQGRIRLEAWTVLEPEEEYDTGDTHNTANQQ